MSIQTGKTAFVIGDCYTLHSGLTYVAKNLKRILRRMGFKVVYISVSGPLHDDKENECHYIGNNPSDKTNPVIEFDKLVEKYRPHLVSSCHDLWMLMTPMLSSYRHTFIWVQYNPVEANYYPQHVIFNRPDDTRIQPISIADVASNSNYIIAYNEFGKKGLEAMGVGNKVRRCIHNGYDPERVYYIEDREVVMNRRRGVGVPDDYILFMHMGRNSTRKRQDVMFEAWYKFLNMLKGKGLTPKAKFYVHTDRYTMNGFDIPSITKRLGIDNTIIMPKDLNFSDNDLNIFYNAADVYVGIPGGEGHGYGFTEAMVLGKPLIYGAYGGHTTYCKGAGIEIPATQFLSAQNIDAPRAVISSNKTAEAMLELYVDAELRKKYGEEGKKLSQQLRWDNLDGEFEEAFNEALAENNPSTIFARRVA